MRNRSLLGISSRFRLLSPSVGQVVYALLTRLPLRFTRASSRISPFDLHVLGTPPAFVLSQDQTLHDSLIAHLFALLPRTFVIDSGLNIQTRTLALIHCIVQFSKNRVASCDFIYTIMSRHRLSRIYFRSWSFFSRSLTERLHRVGSTQARFIVA